VESAELVDLRTQRLASFFAVTNAALQHRPRSARVRSSAAAWLWGVALFCGCETPTIGDTVALGDHFDAPEIALDENFFFCSIQPAVITKNSCARGQSGDADGCHAERSALRLIEVPSEARCQDGRVIGTPPAEAIVNLDRVRSSVGLDADSSPFYRRPLGLDSHPRVIFDARSPDAALIRQWLAGSNP
jgi:hypothetical protein